MTKNKKSPEEKPKAKTPFIVKDGVEVQKIYKESKVLPISKESIGGIWHYTYTEKPKGIK